MTLAFFWGSYLLWKLIHLTVYREEDVFDGVFFSLFVGLIIGRFVYVSLNFSKFGFNPAKIILINGFPGFSIYGGLLGFFLGHWLFFRLKKISYWEIIDYYVAPLFLVFAFAKVGNFFSGSEIGAPTQIFLSVKYAGLAQAHHLTALYEGILFFLGAFLAHRLLFAVRRGNYPKGAAFVFFIGYFALVYFSLDGLKSAHLLMRGYSFNRTVSAILLLTVGFYIVYYFRSQIYHFLSKHGKNTYKIVHRRAKKTLRKREKKDASAD